MSKRKIIENFDLIAINYANERDIFPMGIIIAFPNLKNPTNVTFGSGLLNHTNKFRVFTHNERKTFLSIDDKGNILTKEKY